MGHCHNRVKRQGFQSHGEKTCCSPFASAAVPSRPRNLSRARMLSTTRVVPHDRHSEVGASRPPQRSRIDRRKRCRRPRSDVVVADTGSDTDGELRKTRCDDVAAGLHLDNMSLDQAHSITRDSDHVPGVSSHSNSSLDAVVPLTPKRAMGIVGRHGDTNGAGHVFRERSSQWQAIPAVTLQQRRPEMTDGCVLSDAKTCSSSDVVHGQVGGVAAHKDPTQSGNRVHATTPGRGWPPRCRSQGRAAGASRAGRRQARTHPARPCISPACI
jgi:hypothetical protein